jgi:hypothetical protein
VEGAGSRRPYAPLEQEVQKGDLGAAAEEGEGEDSEAEKDLEAEGDLEGEEHRNHPQRKTHRHARLKTARRRGRTAEEQERCPIPEEWHQPRTRLRQ